MGPRRTMLTTKKNDRQMQPGPVLSVEKALQISLSLIDVRSL